MKLILTQEVTGLGTSGDVVEVKDGYGRNYLVPQGFAVTWTRGAEKQVAQTRKARDLRSVKTAAEATAAASALSGLAVTVTARAGEGGRLFGSVTAADVVDAIRAAGGPTVDRHQVELPTPIKTLGAHTAQVRLHADVVADVAVEVVAS